MFLILTHKLADLPFISKFWVVVCSKLNIQSSGLGKTSGFSSELK